MGKLNANLNLLSQKCRKWYLDVIIEPTYSLHAAKRCYYIPAFVWLMMAVPSLSLLLVTLFLLFPCAYTKNIPYFFPTHCLTSAFLRKIFWSLLILLLLEQLPPRTHTPVCTVQGPSIHFKYQDINQAELKLWWGIDQGRSLTISRILRVF